MDYGKVLTRAWNITWRWKVLWILGFLASLGSGMSGNGSFYQFGSEDAERWGQRIQDPNVIAAFVGIFIAVACVALIVGIALAVVSIIARGGLVAGVQQVEDEGSTSFRSAWRVGRQRFWTLLGISFLAAIPVFVLMIAGLAVMALFVLSIAGTTTSIEAVGAREATIVAPLVVCGLALCCVWLPLTIVLGQIQVYADRAAILEGMGWIDAFKRGWQVLKTNLGPTVVFWLIFLVIGLVIGGVVVAGLLAVFLPLIGLIGGTDKATWIFLPVCLGGLLAVLISAFVQCLYQAFSSATWTLAYRQMTGAGGPAPEGPVLEPLFPPEPAAGP